MSSSNPTRLRLRQPMKGRVDASGLVPELFSYPSQVQIARMPVAVGNDVAELGELFEIVLGDPKYLRIEGDCRNFDQVARELRDGIVEVDGSVGHQLAVSMRGGRVIVRGDAGDQTCAAMRGGMVMVQGSVGNHAAAPLRGQTSGMRGGTLLVQGNAGELCGHRLRRGTLIVRGNVGPACGHAMVAGTIVIGGQAGKHAGEAMRRGTLITRSANHDRLRFTPPHEIDLPFLTLLLRAHPEINELLRPWANDLLRVYRQIGDKTSNGQGEWLSYTEAD